MRIYIAGPYTADTDEQILENVHRALDVGIELINRGYTPFVPHLTHWLEKRAKRTVGSISYERWLEYGTKWLEQCDALLYTASSPGADRELEDAYFIGMPVYRSIDELPPPR